MSERNLLFVGLMLHALVYRRQRQRRQNSPSHQRKPSRPWHIDFCFVPAGWVLVGVEVLDGKEWAARSDHLPLKVDVQLK